MDDDPLESRWSSNLKKLDMFSQEIEILFENNRRTLQTHCGVVFGFFMVFLLMVYGAFKTTILISYEQVKIQQPDFKGHFSLDEPFDHDLTMQGPLHGPRYCCEHFVGKASTGRI